MALQDRERFQELVEKQLDNSITANEKTELESFYELYGNQIAPLKEEEKTRKILYHGILNRVLRLERIDSKKRSRHLMLGAAAAISILLVLGVSTRFWPTQENIELITVTSPMGEVRKVVLPDSSLVTLNAGSSITYPKTFADDIRHVEMTGEVFFEVTHNPKKPFWVSSSELKTKVLGTSFNIKAYADTPELKISLATGSIQVSKQDKIVAVLKPNEQISYDKKSKGFKTSEHRTDRDISWMDNIIELNDHSIKETQRIVERWFNVKLEIKKNDGQKTITGRFIDPTLDETIKSLELLIGSKITYKTM
ncbi:MAG: FecR domain-containing protein [Flavobacteriaceae bacterium]|nr:FecR domain-containing protein [Flavobacteriaceae bacterium]